MIFFLFGVDIWILPNVFHDDLGVIESFSPIIGYFYRKDGWTWFFIRMALLIVVVLFSLQVYKDPSKLTDAQ